MKRFSTAVLTLSVILGTLNVASAQNYGYGDPMASIDNILAELNQQQRQLEQNMRGLQQETIDNFRRMTNDYRSPDHIILQRSMQMARQQNPAAFQALDNSHQARMGNLKSQFEAGQQRYRANQQINDNRMKAYWQNSAASDRIQHQTVNGIWERSDYVNPNTGQTTTLGWNTPHQMHTSGSDTFYTDGNHRQYQSNGGGEWQMLDEINW